MKPSVKYVYFNIGKPEQAPGVITVSLYKKEDWVYYGIALCSPKTVFTRREGRQEASKRLETFMSSSENHELLIQTRRAGVFASDPATDVGWISLIGFAYKAVAKFLCDEPNQHKMRPKWCLRAGLFNVYLRNPSLYRLVNSGLV